MVLYPFANINWWVHFLKNPATIDPNTINYAKNQSYNKYSILNANGILHLSIPIENGRNQRIPFNRIKISYQENWQKIHWRSLTAAYNNSVYFEYYAHLFEPLFTDKWTYLYEFNQNAFDIISKILKIPQRDVPFLTLNDMIEIPEYLYVFNNKKMACHHTVYYQVFEDKIGFIPNMSILDVIFNLGTESLSFLKKTELQKAT